MKDIIFQIKKINIITNFNTKWTKVEDELLLFLTKEKGRKYWNKIKTCFANKSKKSCKLRYNQINPNINKGKWSKKEDNILLNLIENFGFSWKLISKIMKNRNEKQIRSRYINFLFKGINKNKFSNLEDQILLDNFINLETNWTKYCLYLPERSPRQIENRLKSLIKIILKQNESVNSFPK